MRKKKITHEFISNTFRGMGISHFLIWVNNRMTIYAKACDGKSVLIVDFDKNAYVSDISFMTSLTEKLNVTNNEYDAFLSYKNVEDIHVYHGWRSIPDNFIFDLMKACGKL